MARFSGFPAGMRFTPVPSLFLSRLLPDITDIAELKLTLVMFGLVYRKRYPRFLTLPEITAATSNIDLAAALEMVVRRGTFLRMPLEKDGARHELYFLNSVPDRRAAARVERGELELPALPAATPMPEPVPAEPDIFSLYEQNIGVLTPLIADEMTAAEAHYPRGWLADAIKEAVRHGKRRWSYISAILERWSVEGKDDGAHQRYSKADPDRFIKGRYGGSVKR